MEIFLSLKVYDLVLYWYYVIFLIKVCFKRIYFLIKYIKIKVRKGNFVWLVNEGEIFFFRIFVLKILKDL